MLTTQFVEWREQFRAEDEAKGEAKGKAEGMAGALLALLTKRFGAVARSRRKRIHKARLMTLERWFERASVASGLRSVFNPPAD